ncbi:MAG: imidazolonepropionase [Deltaproteobacteria bacterium]|nr:MAG: imidazolonepropionase [Deltaproteobacteria bacterium]
MSDFPEKADAVWVHANLATMTGSLPYGRIENGALAVTGSRITWVGKTARLPADLAGRVGRVHDAGRKWITPGLIDCHTHLVYSGNRASEFEQRLEGASYEEIARRGGGIKSTVTATRAADENSLYAQSRPRLLSLLQEGVTTVEIKSGYGLDIDTEMRMLKVARRLGDTLPVTVMPTFLGAHALPPEFDGRSDDYIDFICRDLLPRVTDQGLAVAVDAFCETIGFSRPQTERVFSAARRRGLPVKLHAEQLSDMGGAELAASFGALSADHLEYLSEAGVRALAGAGTVAVLLPGAFYFLGETQKPPVDRLRRHQVPMAVATDCNPGSSPVGSLLAMLNMACVLFRLTPEEALAGVTCHAARALGIHHRAGILAAGKDADFVIWAIEDPAELAYSMGFNPCRQVIRKGRQINYPQMVFNTKGGTP